jgi:hypothetical protein
MFSNLTHEIQSVAYSDSSLTENLSNRMSILCNIIHHITVSILEWKSDDLLIIQNQEVIDKKRHIIDKIFDRYSAVLEFGILLSNQLEQSEIVLVQSDRLSYSLFLIGDCLLTVHKTCALSDQNLTNVKCIQYLNSKLPQLLSISSYIVKQDPYCNKSDKLYLMIKGWFYFASIVFSFYSVTNIIVAGMMKDENTSRNPFTLPSDLQAFYSMIQSFLNHYIEVDTSSQLYVLPTKSIKSHFDRIPGLSIIQLFFSKVFKLIPNSLFELSLLFCRNILNGDQMYINSNQTQPIAFYYEKKLKTIELFFNIYQVLIQSSLSEIVSTSNKDYLMKLLLLFDSHIDSLITFGKDYILETKKIENITNVVIQISVICRNVSEIIEQTYRNITMQLNRGQRKRNLNINRDVNLDINRVRNMISSWVHYNFSLLSKLLFSLGPVYQGVHFISYVNCLLNTYESIFYHKFPWLGTSIGCICNILNYTLRLIIKEINEINMGTTMKASLSLDNPGITLNQLFQLLQYVSRILKLVAGNTEITKHASYIFIHLIDVLSTQQISDKILHNLLPGLFALLDKCIQNQRKQIHELLNYQSRAFYDELYIIYLRDYKFGTSNQEN